MAGVQDFVVPDVAAGEERSAEIYAPAATELALVSGENTEVAVVATSEVAAEGSEAVPTTKAKVPGVFCHQCRQKRDFAASCKNTRKGKPCMVNICHKCLPNRYGQEVEEVEKIDGWCCPRCRGVCNCSLCMKKKGHTPTGILIHAAKATGYSSVHDLLDQNGSDVFTALDGLKNSKGISSPDVDKVLKRIQNRVNTTDRQKDNEASVSGNDIPEELSLGNEDGATEQAALEIAIREGKEPALSDGDKKPQSHKGSRKKKIKNDRGNITETTSANVDTDNMNPNNIGIAKRRKLTRHIISTEVDLPKGTPLMEVADIDWQPEDIGPALQFLEFCNAFSKVLDLKNGESEHLLRDLARGRQLRQVGSSSILRFLNKVLKLIQEYMKERSISYSVDSGDIWLVKAVEFIDQSDSGFKKFEFGSFPKDLSAYDNLDPSRKLKILNLLCDEALQTEKLRNWMDAENQKYTERKETQKIKSEAKKKGDDLKKKFKDDVAKAMHPVNDDGHPLSVSEQSNLISQMKEESEKAHAAVLETVGMLPKNKQRRDAMRTDPVLCEKDGHVYWELEGYHSNSKIFLQDVGNMSSTILQDRWFSYNQEEEKVIEQHIASTRRKKHWTSRFGKKDKDVDLGYESDDVAGDDGSEIGDAAGDNSDVKRLDSANVAVGDHHAMVNETVADDGHHVQRSEVVDVTGDSSHMKSSQVVDAARDQLKVYEPAADDDHHAKGYNVDDVAGEDNRGKH